MKLVEVARDIWVVPDVVSHVELLIANDSYEVKIYLLGGATQTIVRYFEQQVTTMRNGFGVTVRERRDPSQAVVEEGARTEAARIRALIDEHRSGEPIMVVPA